MQAPEIQCPYCGGPMTAGTSRVHGTFWGFLMVGCSYQHLWFRKDDKEEIIMRSGDERNGHRCTRCGAVTVLPLKRRREGSREESW